MFATSNILFYGSCLGFLSGVFVATFGSLTDWFAGVLLVVSAGLGVLVSFGRKGFLTETDTRPFAAVAVICLFAAIGIVRFDMFAAAFAPEALHSIPFDRSVELIGTVSREVEHDGSRSTLVVDIEKIDGALVEDSAPLRVRVTAPSYSDYRYGDELLLSGVIMRPRPFETETGRIVAYDKLLAKDGIVATMFYPESEHLSSDNGSKVMSTLLTAKHILLASMNRVLPDPHSALAGGILLGVEQSLGTRLEEAFRTTGLIHIVVLSGYNVTLVAVAVVLGLKYLRVGLLPRTIVAVTGIVLFAFLVGLGATVVRASIMAVLVLLAHTIGRRAHMLRALLLASVLMVLINPLILVYDPSFQLSAIATCGLVTISPILDEWFRVIPLWGWMREIFVATVATQAAVLPLLLYMTGTLSLVAIPVNVLALPAVAPAMLFSFISGLVGALSPVLAFPVTLLAYLFLEFTLLVVQVFNSLPFSHMVVPPMPIAVPIVLYILLGAGIFHFYSARGEYQFGMPILKKQLS